MGIAHFVLDSSRRKLYITLLEQKLFCDVIAHVLTPHYDVIIVNGTKQLFCDVIIPVL